MITWVVQDDCTACGLCPEISDRFEMRDDGLAYSVDEGTDGSGETKVCCADRSLVVEAAEECPGECIMVAPF